MTLATLPVVERDGRKRPLITQPDGSTYYATRTSTFANALNDSFGLMTHKMRLLALAMSRREDLAGIGAALTMEERHKEELDRIIDYAMDFIGANAPANYGTAIHLFTEPDCLCDVPERMAPDVKAFNEGLKAEGIAIVATEEFVVNDLYQVAGTFDHIGLHPEYGYVVIDKKTGKLKRPYCAVQLAMYANSQRIDPEDKRKRLPLDVNKEVALVAHIPQGEARCVFTPIDIRAGYLAVKCAAEKRMWQSCKFEVDPIGDAKRNLQKGGLVEDTIIALIHGAQSVEDLNQIYYDNEPSWTDRHMAAGNARKHQLLSA